MISDTYYCLFFVDKTAKRLNEIGVKIVLYGGDSTAPFVLLHFKQLKADLIGVFGNNDFERENANKGFMELNARVKPWIRTIPPPS